MKEINDLIQGVLGPERSTQEVSDGTFFASKLVKMSAKQYAYLSANIKPYQTTLEQIIGSAVAEAVLKDVDQEMGAFIDFFNGYKIAFSIDGFKPTENKNIFIEHKYFFLDSLDNWKIRSAIIQCAFYAALSYKAKKLRTSDFRVKQGFPKKEVDLDVTLPCEISVMITMPRKIYVFNKVLEPKLMDDILNFYIKKAKTISDVVKYKDWNGAKNWDEKYKGVEQDEFFSNIEIEDFEILYEREMNY